MPILIGHSHLYTTHGGCARVEGIELNIVLWPLCVTDVFQVRSGVAERVRRVSEAGQDMDKDLASTPELRPCYTQTTVSLFGKLSQTERRGRNRS